MRLLFPFLLFVGCAFAGCVPPSRVAPAAPLPPADCSDADAVDVVDHAIDLAIVLEPPSLSGRGTVTVRARRASRAVALDAHALAITEAAHGAEALRFTSASDRACVELPRPLAAGESTSLRFAWTAAVDRKTPHLTDTQAWAGYDAASWMPTRQDPAARATLSLRIAAPAGWKIAASGRQVARSSGERATATFVLDHPSPPFLYAFAAGRFDERTLDVDGVTLRALGPASANVEGALALTAPMVRFLRERTGTVPFSTYTQVFVHGDAAQEAAGMAIIGDSALEDVRNDPHEDWVFAHELSHQWFAWHVSCADFSDFWLNEGFATFLTAAIKEARWGRGEYARELALWRRRSEKVHADGRDAPVALRPVRAPREAELQPRGVTYARGALVLDELRATLGDAAFWDGVRRYVKDRAWTGARTDDLRRALEAASGRDLGAYFERRVYQSAWEF